ncbi:hypothetical protein OIE90_33405 (plasmid) [Streptomyces cellulosae]|uniref:hypothetical protein n=1 Tax=Streptomyces cellulosae TaxID=1968 RepID=UPI002ED4BC26|nr:hypothetical protein OG880_33115 [Streptomyces cellulosae]WTB73716.1 hypothetical protein OIE90_33405 [Streptomyces cellulosae]
MDLLHTHFVLFLLAMVMSLLVLVLVGASAAVLAYRAGAGLPAAITSAGKAVGQTLLILIGLAAVIVACLK